MVAWSDGRAADALWRRPAGRAVQLANMAQQAARRGGSAICVKQASTEVAKGSSGSIRNDCVFMLLQPERELAASAIGRTVHGVQQAFSPRPFTREPRHFRDTI
jgi:hypothetical protein